MCISGQCFEWHPACGVLTFQRHPNHVPTCKDAGNNQVLNSAQRCTSARQHWAVERMTNGDSTSRFITDINALPRVSCAIAEA